jgi:cell division transport system ATP-binding protein
MIDLSLRRAVPAPAETASRTILTEAERGAIHLAGISAGYGRNHVLREFEFDVKPGDFIYLVGPSGAGKSTVLKLLYGMIRPLAGTGFVDGVPVHRLKSWQTAQLRRRLGCVFQAYELLPHLSALENVLLPLQLAHPKLRDPSSHARDALEMVGLAGKMQARPAELSGGQQQRVAVARAIAHEPRVLLADEPTGNLDRRNSSEIMEIFLQLKDLGSTIVVATHDELVLQEFPARVVEIQPRQPEAGGR